MHRGPYGRRVNGWAWGIPACAAALLAAAPLSARAQLASAEYAAEEAAAGRALYDRACAACHMPNLSGSFEAPELAGPTFRGAWGGRPVEDLLELVRVTMPPGGGGSLAPEEYAAIVAYVLRRNGFAPGAAAPGGAGAPAAGAASTGLPAVRPPRRPDCRAARARSVRSPSGPRSPTRCCGTPTRRTG